MDILDNNTEQWIEGGDCRICRRRDYCKKDCKLAKQNRDKAIKELIMENTIFGKARELYNTNEKFRNGMQKIFEEEGIE